MLATRNEKEIPQSIIQSARAAVIVIMFQSIAATGMAANKLTSPAPPPHCQVHSEGTTPRARWPLSKTSLVFRSTTSCMGYGFKL